MTSDLPPEAHQAWRDYNAAAQIGNDAYAPFMSGWLAGRYAADTPNVSGLSHTGVDRG